MFTVSGVTYEQVTISDLTLGELEILQDTAGLYGEELDAAIERGDIKLMLALVYIAMLRQNPDATLDDARKVKVSELRRVDDDPPEPRAEEPATTGTPA